MIGNINQNSRILIWSLRNIQNFVYNSCLFEFEDIIHEVDSVDIIQPSQYSFPGRLIKKLTVDNTKYFKSLAYLNPYFNPFYLEKNYDVFFAIIDFPWNISSLNYIKNRKNKCKLSVCYLVEIWKKDLTDISNLLDYLKEFDLIFLGTAQPQVIQFIQELTQRPCVYLPPGIDTVKFHPNLEQENRTIDICNLGRRSPITHQALLNLAENKDFFYYYDLVSGADFRNDDHQQHRNFTSSLLRNSRYFITNYAKINQPERIEGQEEIGYRFFEGAAAGTILLGCPPKNEEFDLYFGWENSIIPIGFNEPNIADILAELDSKPKFLHDIQVNNVVNSLLKHDWVYRWEEILTHLDLPLDNALEERKNKLRYLADAFN